MERLRTKEVDILFLLVWSNYPDNVFLVYLTYVFLNNISLVNKWRWKVYLFGSGSLPVNELIPTRRRPPTPSTLSVRRPGRNLNDKKRGWDTKRSFDIKPSSLKWVLVRRRRRRKGEQNFLLILRTYGWRGWVCFSYLSYSGSVIMSTSRHVGTEVRNDFSFLHKI